MLSPRATALWSLAVAALLCGAGCPRTSAPRQSTDGPAPAGGEQAGAVLEQAAPAVVRVDVTLHLPSGTQTRRGGGFVASEQGLVLTTASAVSSLAEAEGVPATANVRLIEVIVGPGAEDERTEAADVAREHVDLDLALLEIKDFEGQFLTMAGGEPSVGATVFACSAGGLLGQVSVRAGRVVAVSTSGGRGLVELDLKPDPAGTGGPVLDDQGRVIGIQVAGDGERQVAISAATISRWLASRPEEDPDAPEAGSGIKDLLAEAGLAHEDAGDGVFAVTWDNDDRVLVQQAAGYLRVFVPLGEYDPETGLRALAFNYHDPAGRLSVRSAEAGPALVWEAQVPMSAVSAEYLTFLGSAAARQPRRWREFIRGEEPDNWYDLYPGGDEEKQRARIEAVIKLTVGDEYEPSQNSFKITRSDTELWVGLFEGMAMVQRYTGGMPGEGRAQQLEYAEELLRRNWRDPLGRLSLDGDNDLCWEAQVPAGILTPELLQKLLADGEMQVQAVIGRYGEVPFNG